MVYGGGLGEGVRLLFRAKGNRLWEVVGAVLFRAFTLPVSQLDEMKTLKCCS